MNRTFLKVGTAAGAAVSALPLLAGAVFAQGRNIRNITIEPSQGFATDIGVLIQAVLSFVMVIAALLVFLYLIWGGIEWITSGGDKGKTENARGKITAAVIGLIILATAFAVLTLVLNFLGFSGGVTGSDNVFQNIRFINEAG